ncbi:hypothetical protein WSM22_44440 [Cytophagales bacterium WSM2-2]|nr:hypothetical protein WSM22_44440 [Cytophagales bacterium WSM2-2]
MRFFLATFFALTFCKPSANTTVAQQSPEITKIIQKELGEGASSEANRTNTFVLSFKNDKKSLRYIVIRLSDNQVVVRKKLRGSVTWTGDMLIKESEVPGMIKADSKPGDFIKTIDLNQFVVHRK